MCRFFKPTRFSLGTRTPTFKDLLAAGMGSEGLSITTNRQVCWAAVAGVAQSHSRIVGSVADRDEMIFAGPIGNQFGPLGKLVQKLAGRAGNPAEAFAKNTWTVTLAPAAIPRL